MQRNVETLLLRKPRIKLRKSRQTFFKTKADTFNQHEDKTLHLHVKFRPVDLGQIGYLYFWTTLLIDTYVVRLAIAISIIQFSSNLLINKTRISYNRPYKTYK